jgi:hypothetical protein
VTDSTIPRRRSLHVTDYSRRVRIAVWILLVVALPGLIYGSLVRASAPRDPDCGRAGNGLLSLFESRPCPPAGDGVMLVIGMIVVVAVIVVGVARARPR